VQAMVYGNQSDESGTGVAFSRDPSTGTAGIVGDFLVRAQGEDVVAGTHETEPLSSLSERWPDLGAQLTEVVEALERDVGDLVDVEFTVEHGVLWLLQTRVGKRSPRAALRVAVAMAEDPTFPLDRAAAVARVAYLLDEPPTDVPDAPDGAAEIVAEGLGASPGRAVGIVCTDPDEAVRLGAAGTAVILVRPETSPADIHGMAAARGLVTTLGGLMSHAAVVARSWGLPAVVGVADVAIERSGIRVAERRIGSGEVVTVDGDRGLLLLGSHPGEGAPLPEVRTLRAWQAELGEETADGSHQAGPESAPVPEIAARGALSAEDCRRALVLKGMATAEGIAAFARVSAEAAAAALTELVEAGEAQVGPGDRFMITPEGMAAADAAYRAEAAGAASAIEPHLDRFHELNLRFKEVVTDWQMREVDGERVMNDHSNADHDAAVLSALTGEVQHGIVAVIDAVSDAVPRLAVYRDRLGDAVAAIVAGDTAMVASPLKESYHTVWFELHEELIRLSGRNRADEAAAGRA
ncbi:MAG: PEP-utilizing enzyme, partial [Acidimicrobiia bacterium]|nr:PEP-utilizing enzyme [Acidimicrobiia bacterium]